MKTFYKGKVRYKLSNGYMGSNRYHEPLKEYYWFRRLSEKLFNKNWCLTKLFYIDEKSFELKKQNKDKDFYSVDSILSKQAIKFLKKNFDRYGMYAEDCGFEDLSKEENKIFLFYAIKGDVRYSEDNVERMFYNNLMPTSQPNIGYNRKTTEYCGWTHRGGCSFGIGDKLFDEDAKLKHIDSTDILKAYKKFAKSIIKRVNENDTNFNWYPETPMEYIPFKRRGSKTIETMEEAFQAAKNIAEYLS